MATCPLCDEPLSIQPGAKILGQTAECYEDCWEVCLRCRIGLSNAKDPSRTFIRQDWKDGLWRRSTAGRLEEMIAGSLNEQSRKKKKGRLANERSEDLLTWNVFSWLEDRDLLGHLMAMFGGDASSSVQIFYWGANDRYPLPLDLKAILVGRFKESAQFLSEPDVILINAQRVVLIEAKLGSGNISVPGDVRVDKYVNAMPAWFAPVVSVRQAGFYELTRNWAIGAALATALGRQFSLVNLVREVDEHDIATSFGGVLAPLGQFQRHTWEQLATRSWCHASNGRPFTSSQRLPQSLNARALVPDAHPACLDDESFPFLQRLWTAHILSNADWANIIDWLDFALGFLRSLDQTVTTDSEGDLILDLDADPRNAEWVNIVHVHTLAGHRLPGWAALWLGWLAHDRGPTFWQRVATVAGEAGLEKLPANPKLREEPRSILAGVDDIIERHLGIGQIGTRQPRYAHLSACRALSGAPRFAFDSAKLIDEMLERIKANWMGGAAMRPSSNENWRFQKQLHIAAHNLSPETTLEKRIASVMDGAWVNQVPTASGLVNSATDKRRNLDLVHRVAPGEFAFIELKVGSNTPLHAAMELLEYAVLYLFARLNAEPRDLHKQGLLTAIAVHLRVLAPAPYYQRFCFDWLEKDLTNGLNAVIAKNGLRLRMDFAFWAFPHEFAWPCSDETLVAAVDGRRQVRWTT